METSRQRTIFRKLLVRAVIIVGVFLALAIAWVTFNVLAPCEYHNPTLMEEAKLIVAEVERHYAVDDTLPSKADLSSRLPQDASWKATVLAEGGFEVLYFGIGLSFDGPWVEYHSATGAFRCHSQ